MLRTPCSGVLSLSINVAALPIFFNLCSNIWSKTARSLTTSSSTRRKVMNVNLSKLMIICWINFRNLLMSFVKNGSRQKRELRLLRCSTGRSTFLFRALSNLRISHKPRPQFTAETLRSITDDEGKKSGIVIDIFRIWSIFDSILCIYDVEESSDVSRVQSPS
jgi:hypothetical protein